MNTTATVIISIVATLMLTMFAVRADIENLIAYAFVFILFLSLDYLQRVKAYQYSDALSLLKLQAALVLTKSIF